MEGWNEDSKYSHKFMNLMRRELKGRGQRRDTGRRLRENLMRRELKELKQALYALEEVHRVNLMRRELKANDRGLGVRFVCWRESHEERIESVQALVQK